MSFLYAADAISAISYTEVSCVSSFRPDGFAKAVLTAKLRRLLVHHLHKTRRGFRPHAPPTHSPAWLEELHQQQVETIAHRKRVALLDGVLVSAAIFHVVNGIVGKCDRIIQTAVLNDYERRQYFRDTCRRFLHMDVLPK